MPPPFSQPPIHQNFIQPPYYLYPQPSAPIPPTQAPLPPMPSQALGNPGNNPQGNEPNIATQQ